MKTPAICFSVEGAPVPKPVGPPPPRSAPMKRRGPWNRYYAHKMAIGYAANPFFPGCLQGPIEVSVSFYLPNPKGASAAQLRLMGEGVVVPTGKPDLKNLIATVEDALTAIAWTDDSQVVSYGFAYKRYAASGPPRTFIRIEPLERGLRYDEAMNYSSRIINALAAEQGAEI